MMTDQVLSVKAGYKKRNLHYALICMVLALLTLSLMCFELIYGKTVYTPAQIINAIKDTTGKAEGYFTIVTLRLPRTIIGALAGIAFGMAGNTFQKLLRNPLASPDIIGVTSGASVAAVFGILILGLSGSIVSIMAVVSGIIVACVLFFLSKGRGFSNGRLILIGIGAQAFLNGLISWMLLKASEYDVPTALRWLSGSLNGVKIEGAGLLAVVVICCSVCILLLTRHLQVLRLGDDFAVTLGAAPNMVRIALILLALLLTAFATSISGPIASVAFLSGPIADRLTGGGKDNMLSSAFVGSILVLAADIAGQYAFSVRYPVGVITGILGAPYLLYLLLRMNKKG
jgi:iron complex transport system permease protein